MDGEVIQVSKKELKEIFRECVAHDVCPLGMSKSSVDASRQLVKIIPDLAKIADNADNIVAAGNLYGDGKKTVSASVKFIIIAGIVSIFVAGIWAKISELLGK
jgi:hypothetical protein